MNDSTISSLKEALKHSPENVPLRLLLAETLQGLSRLDEAEEEYKILLNYSDDTNIKTGLAGVYYQRGRFSACNVILEEVIESGSEEAEVLGLYAKGLLKENAFAKALEIYQLALSIYPDFFDEELDQHFRLKEVLNGMILKMKVTTGFWKSQVSILVMLVAWTRLKKRSN